MNAVFITGVGKGIGKQLALMFLKNGYHVVGTSTTGSVDYSHENLKCLELDLSSASSISACVSEVRAMNRTFDILVNNAGVLLDENEKSLIPELLRKTLEVNLIGTADLTEQMLPYVNADGHIVFLSSSSASIGRTGHSKSRYPSHYPAYKISKTALNMYMRTLALRMSDNQITVSSVHPGWARTDMGGADAPISAEEAAETVYNIAVSRPETGQFWSSEGKLPW